MAATPDYLGAKNSKCTIITDADTTSDVVIFTAGANGARVHLASVSTDATTPSVQLKKSDGTTTCILGTFDIPTNAGRDGVVPAVDLLDATLIPAIPADPGQFLTLGPNETLLLAALATITAAMALHVVVDGIDY